MRATVRYRDYQVGDFPYIQKLWLATDMGGAHRGDDATTIEATLAHGGRFWVLEDQQGGPLAGSAWLTTDGRRLYLHHFAIRPDLQGRGLGRELLNQVMAAARSMGLQLKLEVRRDNTRAQKLYRRGGFQPLGDYEVLIIRETGRKP